MVTKEAKQAQIATIAGKISDLKPCRYQDTVDIQSYYFPNGIVYDLKQFWNRKVESTAICYSKQKRPFRKEKSLLVTHTRESLHLIKQEGKRWREILDPMYREYKLQIRRRD